MKPNSEKTGLFRRDTNPREGERNLTKQGVSHGQTAKVSPASGNPVLETRPEKSNALGKREIIAFYRSVAEEIYSLIPGGSFSGEVCPGALRTTAGMTRGDGAAIMGMEKELP